MLKYNINSSDNRRYENTLYKRSILYWFFLDLSELRMLPRLKNIYKNKCKYPDIFGKWCLNKSPGKEFRFNGFFDR